MAPAPWQASKTEYHPAVILLERLLCAAFYYSGLNWAFRTLFTRDQCLVLMYHRVIDPDHLSGPDAQFLHPGMHVTKQAFEMQMRYLSQRYRVMDVTQLITALHKRRKLPRNACVITFDDGWRDNYTWAFPILKKYHLPATIFLVTDYVGTHRWFWHERIEFLLSKYLERERADRAPLPRCAALRRNALCPVLADPRLTDTKKIVECIEILKTSGSGDREDVARELEEVLAARGVEIRYSERLILNWDEVAEMSHTRITFGAHTRTHAILTAIPAGELVPEIAGSKLMIEERLRRPCTSFCYPNGDFNGEVREHVMTHYACAFSTHPGLVRPRDDLFSLRRVGIRHAASFTRALFACKCSGALGLLVGATQRFGKLRRRVELASDAGH